MVLNLISLALIKSNKFFINSRKSALNILKAFDRPFLLLKFKKFTQFFNMNNVPVTNTSFKLYVNSFFWQLFGYVCYILTHKMKHYLY